MPSNGDIAYKPVPCHEYPTTYLRFTFIVSVASLVAGYLYNHNLFMETETARDRWMQCSHFVKVTPLQSIGA